MLVKCLWVLAVEMQWLWRLHDELERKKTPGAQNCCLLVQCCILSSSIADVHCCTVILLRRPRNDEIKWLRSLKINKYNFKIWILTQTWCLVLYELIYPGLASKSHILNGCWLTIHLMGECILDHILKYSVKYPQSNLTPHLLEKANFQMEAQLIY